MFEGTDYKESPRLNILFFCATNYGPKIKELFGANKIFCNWKLNGFTHIQEVIICDLSSKENRLEFFGLTDFDLEGEAVELVISKADPVYSKTWAID